MFKFIGMRRAFILLLLLSTCWHVRAQAPYPDVRLEGINIAAPQIKAVEISKEQYQHMKDSFFTIRLLDYDKEQPEEEENWREKLPRKYRRLFKKYRPVFLRKFKRGDSVVYQRELRNMEDEIRAHAKVIKVSDTLKRLLLQYPGNQFLLTDIAYYCYYTSHSKAGTCYNYLLIQCMIVDDKTGLVVFHHATFWDDISLIFDPDFKIALKDLQVKQHK